MKEEISNNGSQSNSPIKHRVPRQHETNVTREQMEDQLNLIKSFGLSKSSSDFDHSAANIVNMKINSSIITQ